MAYDQRQWGSKWPVDEHVPGFRNEALAFMTSCESTVHKLLECFALGLGMPYEDFKMVHTFNSGCNANGDNRFHLFHTRRRYNCGLGQLHLLLYDMPVSLQKCRANLTLSAVLLFANTCLLFVGTGQLCKGLQQRHALHEL